MNLLEKYIVSEGAEKFEMAFTRFMHTGEDGIGRPQSRLAPDAPAGDTVSSLDATMTVSRRLKRSHNRCADGDDALPVRMRPRERGRRSLWDAIRLIERQLSIECWIAGRGDAGGMGQRGKADPALPPRFKDVPVEGEPG